MYDHEDDQQFNVEFEEWDRDLAPHNGGAAFNAFDYDSEEIGHHKTSISTSGLEHYLKEYSIHDDHHSPSFIRTYNGIPFDKTFQKRNNSSFTVGSLEQLEICGVEIGVFSMSPPTTFMHKVR